jgi:hypothetical protein
LRQIRFPPLMGSGGSRPIRGFFRGAIDPGGAGGLTPTFVAGAGEMGAEVGPAGHPRLEPKTLRGTCNLPVWAASSSSSGAGPRRPRWLDLGGTAGGGGRLVP